MVRTLLFILTVAGTLFFTSSCFVDSCFVPKWLVLAGGVIIAGVLSSVHVIHSFDRHFSDTHQVVALAITLLVLVEAIYGVGQFLSTPSSSIVGTLDNPAGFAVCLCAGLPFCLYLMKDARSWLRLSAIMAGVVIVTAVLLSQSRAGMISVCVMLIGWMWKRCRFPSVLKVSVLLAVFAVSLPLLYHLKKDSADGRLLIWRCSWEQWMDKPLLGWGRGGFEAHYMDYQAEYFGKHPDSVYSLLADTVQYPFNEYLHIGVISGILGLLSVALLLGFLFRCYVRHPTDEKESGMLCWLSVAVFALFSYPLMYPFVWLMLGYSAYLLIGKKWVSVFSVPVRKAGALVLLCVCVVVGSQVYSRMRAELAWADVLYSSRGDDEDVLVQYKKIAEELGTDRYFLYNYAFVLRGCGEYEESLSVALKCRQLWADYDLELLLAELYEQKGENTTAEKYYRHASLMCPNRFIPLFQLTLLLNKSGRIDEARELARQIVEKPVKVPSYQIESIRKEMSDYIINRDY